MKGYYNSNGKNMLLIQNLREAFINIKSFQIKIGKKYQSKIYFYLVIQTKLKY